MAGRPAHNFQTVGRPLRLVMILTVQIVKGTQALGYLG